MNSTFSFIPSHLLKRQGHCTISDYLTVPTATRIQLIGGTLVPGESATLRHQQIILGLISQMIDVLHTPNSPWKIITSPVRLAFPKRDDCVFLPDLAIINHPASLKLGLLTAAPVFAAEVLSEQSEKADTIQKADIYQSVGCKEYWTIDPAKEVVYVHILGSALTIHYSFRDTLPVQCFPGMFCFIPTSA